MKNLLLLLGFLALVGQAWAQPTYDFRKVDQLLEKSLPTLKGQGGGYAVTVLAQGETIYRKSFGGFAHDRPVPIASASKWLAGAVMMTLVDAGKLALDDKVCKYLPELTGLKGNMTIRQLFSHTAGFPGEGMESRTLNQRNIPFDSIVAQIGAGQLVAKPGAEFHYGGLSMQIAGRAAEIAAGKAWEEIFQENIARPLGMTRTTFGKTREGRNPRIAGGAVSTGDDYIKFLQMLLNKGKHKGRQILSEKAVDQMLVDQTGQAKMVDSPFSKFQPLLKDKKEVRYGIGVWREVAHPTTGQIIEAVSPGAFGFTPWIDFENKLMGVISIRSAFLKVMPVYLQMKGLIKAELALQASQNKTTEERL